MPTNKELDEQLTDFIQNEFTQFKTSVESRLDGLQTQITAINDRLGTTELILERNGITLTGADFTRRLDDMSEQVEKILDTCKKIEKLDKSDNSGKPGEKDNVLEFRVKKIEEVIFN